MTALKGIGPWTAEIYLLFCVGHPDIFPAGDLALQVGVQHGLRLRERPDEKTLQKNRGEVDAVARRSQHGSSGRTIASDARLRRSSSMNKISADRPITGFEFQSLGIVATVWWD